MNKEYLIEGTSNLVCTTKLEIRQEIVQLSNTGFLYQRFITINCMILLLKNIFKKFFSFSDSSLPT